MNISSYVNQDIVEKLLSNSGNVENVTKYFCEIKNIPPANISKSFVPDIFINRKDEINDIESFFNDTAQRVLLLSGIQGTGKSTLIRSMLTLAEEPVLIFWYECSKITNLDDLLLSLCAYFDKKKSTTQSLKGQSFASIDERLISYLKALERPLVIVLDSFEHLVTADFKIENEELKFFFNFLLDNNKVKLILSGQRLPTNDMDYNDDFVAVVKIGGLPETDSVNLLRANGMISSNSVLADIYKFSRGYPWVLLLSTVVSSKFNVEPEKIVKAMSYYEESFESYLLKVVYKALPKNDSKILDYLSAFRHPVNVPLLVSIDNSIDKVESRLENLVKLNLVKSTGKRFSVNNAVKKYVYSLIPDDVKSSLHNKISKFYGAEISKKLAERTIRISRKLLHSEQYYHNTNATKLSKSVPVEPKKLDKKIPINYTGNDNKENSFALGDIDPKYMHLLNQPNTEKPEPVDLPLEAPLKKLPDKNNEKSNEVINIDGLELELSAEELEMVEAGSEDDKQEQSIPSQVFVDDDIPLTPYVAPYIETYDDLEQELSSDGEEQPESETVDMLDSLRFVAKGYANEGKYGIAIDRYNEALELAVKINDPIQKAQVLFPLANSYRHMKNYDKSIECYEAAKDIYEGLNDYTDIPEILTNMAKVYYECYKHEKALSVYTSVLKMPHEYLQNHIKASVFMGMGEIFDYHQRFNDALNYYFQALKSYEEINDISNMSVLYSRIGLIYDDLEDYDRAIVNYQRSLELDKKLDKKQHYAATLSNIAAVYDEIGNKTQSLNYYKQSLVIDKELDNIEGLYKTFGRVGTIYVELGNAESALKYYQYELKVAKKAQDPFWIAMAYLDLGDLYYYISDYEEATRSFMLSQKVIANIISTDSKEKIERRLRKIQEHIPKDSYDKIKKQVYNQ